MPAAALPFAARRPFVLAALLPLLTALPGQGPVLGKDESAVRWVEGRPMLRATLRAGDKVYFCHLLLDLTTQQPLFLHRNAAGSLRAETCDVELGGIRLAGLGFTQKRDTWLEGLTAAFAEELQQVPVAGILGLSAFGVHDVVLDGPQKVLRMRGPTSAGAEAPPASAQLVAIPYAGDRNRDGLLLALDLGAASANFRLHTRDPFSWVDPNLAGKAGHRDGLLARASAAPQLDFARWTPFRPLAAESGDQGGIGGAVLQQLVLTFQPEAGRLLVEVPQPIVYPEVEAAFYRALFGSQEAAPLREFLQAHADSKQAAEAAQALFERLGEHGGTPEQLQEAGLWMVRTAPANKRATQSLEVLEHLGTVPELWPVRRAIAEAGLAEARTDEDGSATHKLHLELGRLARHAGDAKAARRHLLASVFGTPVSGPANLELGHWHRDQGEMEAAMNRYFLALLDMKNTGQEGFVAFEQAFRQVNGKTADLLAALLDMADGRVPSFQPIPRDPATVKKTGRAVLVELFTGAMCPPCVAADVAADGLTQLYGEDELVLLQWHLPVPAPEPLVAPCSLERAGELGVEATPTVVFGGTQQTKGGGKAEDAPEMFRRYREQVEAQLAEAPALQIELAGSVQDDAVELRARVVPKAALGADWRLHLVLAEDLIAFPGKNGVLFHHRVARARLSPPEGAPCADGATARTVVGKVGLRALGNELDDLVTSYESKEAFLVRPVRPDPARLVGIAFVQDARTGAVLQAKALPLVGAGR